MRIMACLAASWDGKISLPATRQYVRMSSEADIQSLKALRDEADAVLVGGSTFRAFPKVHRGLNPKKTLLHCILTRSITHLPPDAPLFQQQPEVPILIFTATPPTPDDLQAYPASLTWVQLPVNGPSQAIVASMLDALRGKGIESLLIEGGGEVMALFLEAQALQELYLTLCPLLIGGNQTPSLLSGTGFTENPPHTELLSLEQKGQEIFLHLRMQYPASLMPLP